MGRLTKKEAIIVKQKISYKEAGVDIEKADQAIDSSRGAIQKTFTADVLSSVGGFGSMYSLKNLLKNYDDPILVQSIDGVGTKMSVAQKCNDFRSIGTDLVSACCNDVAVTGARPLTFLDYIASDSLNPETVSKIIKSVAAECEKIGVSLVGGETAEMPGTYRKNEYDLVGVATGVIDKKDVVDGSTIKKGDVVLGLPSSGLHTNGYSLARKLIFDALNLKVNDSLPGHAVTVGEALLAPHKNYSATINSLISKKQSLAGIAHITGGGLLDNIPRILPDGVSVEININSWDKIPIFDFMAKNLDLKNEELYRTFNMGIGLVFVVDTKNKEKIMNILKPDGCIEIGHVIEPSSQKVCLNER